jgi:hypothetical protein
MLNMEENIAALARAKSELAKRFNIQSLEVRATTVPEYDWSIDSGGIQETEEALPIDADRLLQEGRIIPLSKKGEDILRNRAAQAQSPVAEKNRKIAGVRPGLDVHVRIRKEAAVDPEKIAEYLFYALHWQIPALRIFANAEPPREYERDALCLDARAYQAFMTSQKLRDPERELMILFGPQLDTACLVRDHDTLQLDYETDCNGLEPFLGLYLAAYGQPLGVDTFVLTRISAKTKQKKTMTLSRTEVQAYTDLEKHTPIPDYGPILPAVRPLNYSTFEEFYRELFEKGQYMGRFHRIDLESMSPEADMDLAGVDFIDDADQAPTVAGQLQDWEERTMMIEYGDHAIAPARQVRALIGGGEGFDRLKLRYAGNVYTIATPDILDWKPEAVLELLDQVVKKDLPLKVSHERMAIRLREMKVSLDHKPLSIVYPSGHAHGGRSRTLYSPFKPNSKGNGTMEETLYALFSVPPGESKTRDQTQTPGSVTVALRFDCQDYRYSTQRIVPLRDPDWRRFSVVINGEAYPLGHEGKVRVALDRLIDRKKARAQAVEKIRLSGGLVSSTPKLMIALKEAGIEFEIRFAVKPPKP